MSPPPAQCAPARIPPRPPAAKGPSAPRALGVIALAGTRLTAQPWPCSSPRFNDGQTPPGSPIAGGHSKNKPGLARGPWGWMALSWVHMRVPTRQGASTVVRRAGCCSRTCIPLQTHTHMHASASIHDHAYTCTRMIVQARLRLGTCMHTHTCMLTRMDAHILTRTAQQPGTAPAPTVSSLGGDTRGQDSPQTPRPHAMCRASVSPLGTAQHPHSPRTCGPRCGVGRVGQAGAPPAPGAGTAATSQNHSPAIASQLGSQTLQLSRPPAKPAPDTGRSIVPCLFSASPSSTMAKFSSSQSKHPRG